MNKTKARDILICWPVPRSTSTPFNYENIYFLRVTPLAELQEGRVSPLRFSGRKWSEMELEEHNSNVAYHTQQAEMLSDFRKDERAMAALRVHCQLSSKRRREQFVLINTSGGQRFMVGTHIGFPEGALLMRFGLCGIGAATPMSCMFCQFGHMTECHFPHDCQTARCEHLTRYVDEVMPPASERVQ